MKSSVDSSASDSNHQIRDILLMVLAWFTVSPLIIPINKNQRYMRKWVMWAAIIASPLATTILGSIFTAMLFGLEAGDYLLDEFSGGYVYSLSFEPIGGD